MANKIELGLSTEQQQYIATTLRDQCKAAVAANDDAAWDKVGKIANRWSAIMEADAAPPAEKKTRGPRKAKAEAPPAPPANDARKGR